MWRRGVIWFGKYTDIASLVSLSFWFYHTPPAYMSLGWSGIWDLGSLEVWKFGIWDLGGKIESWQCVGIWQLCIFESFEFAFAFVFVFVFVNTQTLHL